MILFIILFIFLFIIILNSINWYINNIDYKTYEPKINIVENKNIEFYCKNHLGDSIFNTYFLNFISPYAEKNNIIIKYYCNKDYHNQIQEFINSKNVILMDYQMKGLNLNNLNINYNYNYYNCQIKDRLFNNSKLIHDIHYINLFNEILINIKYPIKMNEFKYTNTKLLESYNNLPEKYKNLDIFIINSIPNGGQYYTNLDNWDPYINELNEEFKIATTKKIKSNILCTMDDNLSVFKIAAISTHAKILIAINTGPMAGCFNSYTLNYANKIYLFDWNVTYSFKNIINTKKINDININEIRKIIKSYK
jgi:hypothetical protein